MTGAIEMQAYLSRLKWLAASLAVVVLTAGGALADQVKVAVAANFTEAAKEIAAAFMAETGHEAVLSFGSTGQIYAQITQGAPFEVFLGTAPYGTAAIQAMSALNVYDSLQPKIVQGANIAQAYQFVKTGNAELGFVALSQIAANTEGSRWIVSDDLYDPIRQDAVLLKTGQDNPAAETFLSFLKSAAVVALIEKYGYGADKTE